MGNLTQKKKKTRRRKGRLDMELEVENLRIFLKELWVHVCINLITAMASLFYTYPQFGKLYCIK